MNRHKRLVIYRLIIASKVKSLKNVTGESIDGSKEVCIHWFKRINVFEVGEKLADLMFWKSNESVSRKIS